MYGGNDGHRASLLCSDNHLRHAVLQRLKGADRDAELLAGLQVAQRRLVERCHDAQGLRTERGDRGIYCPLNDAESLPRLADQGRRGHISEL